MVGCNILLEHPPGNSSDEKDQSKNKGDLLVSNLLCLQLPSPQPQAADHWVFNSVPQEDLRKDQD